MGFQEFCHKAPLSNKEFQLKEHYLNLAESALNLRPIFPLYTEDSSSAIGSSGISAAIEKEAKKIWQEKKRTPQKKQNASKSHFLNRDICFRRG